MLGPVWMPVSAVFIKRALISNGDARGYLSRSRAAEPAIIGVAPEVPPNAASPVPVPATAETDAPGAPISGFTVWKLMLGPRAEVLAMLFTRGSESWTVTLTVAPAFLISVA